MPRRYLDYPDAYAGWNVVASFGSYISFFSFVYFFYIVYLTLAEGPKCAHNPWVEGEDAEVSGGLEWLLPSPPAFHTYGDMLPVIRPTPVTGPIAHSFFHSSLSMIFFRDPYHFKVLFFYWVQNKRLLDPIPSKVGEIGNLKKPCSISWGFFSSLIAQG